MRQNSHTRSLAVLALALIIAMQHARPGDARVYGKCALARKLHRYGVPYHELADWLCLVEGESAFNTKAINPSNADGSVDWGLFQINDRYWCKPSDGRPSSDSCRLPCRLLLSDDLRYAIACARYIRREQGFSAWVAWNNRCQGAKPSVRQCFRRRLPMARKTSG